MFDIISQQKNANLTILRYRDIYLTMVKITN
jgi:hypothetical protein